MATENCGSSLAQSGRGIKPSPRIKDIYRNGLMTGIGKPEALKHIKGYSRHIDHENRLVYSSDENHNLRILSCNGHYI